MEHKKKYSTYAEIDRELEILKLEREIYYQKTFLSIHKTKESLRFSNLVGSFFGPYKAMFSGSYSTLLSLAIPLILKWIKNRKRGD